MRLTEERRAARKAAREAERAAQCGDPHTWGQFNLTCTKPKAHTSSGVTW